jgi:hypothetical protein
MGGKAGGEQFASWPTHPVEAYGDSDLAVAFYGKQSKASARAIVWPEQKIYSTLYGDTNTLRKMLEDAGYTSDSVSGAKIRAIPYRTGRKNSYYLPYVDGISRASLSSCKKWFYLDDDGDFDCSDTCGYSGGLRPRATCENCSDDYDPDSEGSNGFCDSCAGDMQSCERCGHTAPYENSEWVSLDRGTYCETCAEQYASSCETCGASWHEELLSANARSDRDHRGVTMHCVSCERGKSVCSDCNTLVDSSEDYCDDCRPEPEEETEQPVTHPDMFSPNDTPILSAPTPTPILATDPNEGLHAAVLDTPHYHALVESKHGYLPYCTCNGCISVRVNADYSEVR